MGEIEDKVLYFGVLYLDLALYTSFISGHEAIFDGEKFLVLGGAKSGGGAVSNEVCTLIGASIACREASNKLDDYYAYPELFLVTENYGSEIYYC